MKLLHDIVMFVYAIGPLLLCLMGVVAAINVLAILFKLYTLLGILIKKNEASETIRRHLARCCQDEQ